MARYRLACSGAFVVAFLAIQLTYPALAWFLPGVDSFSWRMFAGTKDRPQFRVVMADGRVRDVGNLLERGNGIRLLGPSVDEARFVPPFLCQRWPKARVVELRYERSGRTQAVTCPGR